jgi:hypothetical protein
VSAASCCPGRTRRRARGERVGAGPRGGS